MDKKEISTTVIHKEIDLIQACISRMASNSFLLKGWFISLIAVVLAILKEKSINVSNVMIISIITLAFWYLDAFFLRTEKLYRKLYEWVIKQRPLGNDDNLYDLDTRRFTSEVGGIIKVMFSKTLLWFYLIPPVLVSIILNFDKIKSMFC